jgi:hypothetical protein
MRLILLAMPLLLSFALAACSGTGTESPAATESTLSGPIELRITEADDHETLPAADTPARIFVTIAQIDARSTDQPGGDDHGAWTTLSAATTRVDLLSLRGGRFASLGPARFAAGQHQAVRLYLSPSEPSYVVTADGVRHGIAMTPGTQTWFEVAGHIDLAACATGHVTLEFAGMRSLAVEVGYGTWTLRPAIRVSDVVATGGCSSQ